MRWRHTSRGSPSRRAGFGRAERGPAASAETRGQAAVRIGPRSSLAAVALTVGDALRRHGIRAVLTGGACASLYARGAYQSRDMDLIVAGAVTQPGLDRAMASVGFHRSRDRYVHVGSRG